MILFTFVILVSDAVSMKVKADRWRFVEMVQIMSIQAENTSSVGYYVGLGSNCNILLI